MDNNQTKTTRQLKKRDKIIIVSAIIFILLAFIALIYNVTVLVRANAHNRRLEQQSYELQRQIEENEREQDFRNSPEFIEDFARRYLEMHRRGESLFIAR